MPVRNSGILQRKLSEGRRLSACEQVVIVLRRALIGVRLFFYIYVYHLPDILFCRINIVRPLDQPYLILAAECPLLLIQLLPLQKCFLSAKELNCPVMLDSLILDRSPDRRDIKCWQGLLKKVLITYLQHCRCVFFLSCRHMWRRSVY